MRHLHLIWLVTTFRIISSLDWSSLDILKISSNVSTRPNLLCETGQTSTRSFIVTVNTVVLGPLYTVLYTGLLDGVKVIILEI